jgi:hypothetical protein
MAFEQWVVWVGADAERARVLAMLDFKRGWGVKLMVSLLSRNHVGAVRRSFSVWSGAVEEGVRHDVVVQRIVRRWQVLGLSRALCEWKEFTAARQRSRKLAARVFQRVVNGRLVQAWSTWVGVVEEGRRHDVAAARVIGRLRRNAAQRAYNRWVEHTQERFRIKYLVPFLVLL